MLIFDEIVISLHSDFKVIKLPVIVWEEAICSLKELVVSIIQCRLPPKSAFMKYRVVPDDKTARDSLMKLFP